jgi:L-asparaginase II
MQSYWRSAMKPFQTLPVVEDAAAVAFGMGSEEIALCCASHGGMAMHTDRVAGMLRRMGLRESDLHCGPHVPFHRESAQILACAGREPARLHNNCSGKHAGMLALALHHGWDHRGYEAMDHPVQRRIREVLARWMDVDPEVHKWALDGCGVPTPLLPLREMARAYARLVRAAREGEEAPAAVVEAMTTRRELTSSPGRVPLVIMEATAGRLLAKEGAEGVLCVAAVDEDWGLAVKVEDGSLRAVGPATVELLDSAGLLRAAESETLAQLRCVPIVNTLGERVGAIRARRVPLPVPEDRRR